MNISEPPSTSNQLPQRVLMVAYACSPYKGSEYTVGWGRALATAKHCETWLLAGPESEPDIKRYISENGEIPNLHFCFLAPDRVSQFLNRMPALYAHNYAAINNWHRCAKTYAAHLHQQINFDLAHHVNITGYREPGYLWQLDIPFVWGPVSGTQNLPWRFLPSLGLAQGIKEALRNCVNIAQMRWSGRVRKAADNAAALITANSTNRDDFLRVSKNFPILLLETGLQEVLEVLPKEINHEAPLRILWSGEHKAFKGLPLLVNALAALPPQVKYELKILGRGPLTEYWKQLCEQRGVKAEWCGFVPYSEIMQQYDWADVFIFTSLRDTSGNVMLEALSRGVPVIAPDHQGAADIIDAQSGLKIRVHYPEQFSSALTDAIELLFDDRVMLEALSHGALTRARDFLWSQNALRMAEIYQYALSEKATQTSPMIEEINREDAVHAQ